MRRFLLWWLPLLLPASFVYAEACRVGAVLRVAGDVTMQRQARSFMPFSGLQVCRGDRFVTGPGGIAEVRLRDGSLITVGRSSEFVIREYRIYNDKPNVALFDLVRGAFRSVTGTITARAHRYEVHSRVATIGVRGTDFWGGYGLSGNGLDVVMLEGRGVYVDSATGGHVELDQRGLGTTVPEGGAPAGATVWGEEKLRRAFATITP